MVSITPRSSSDTISMNINPLIHHHSDIKTEREVGKEMLTGFAESSHKPLKCHCDSGCFYMLIRSTHESQPALMLNNLNLHTRSGKQLQEAELWTSSLDLKEDE